MGVSLGSAYGEIIIDTSGIQKGLKSARDEVRGFEASLKQVGKTLTVAGAVMTGLATKVTLTAARTEELGIVLENIAKQTGHSMEAIKQQEAAIKDLGITTQVADQLLIKMMQNNLDLARATDLARLAQDAAVISMEDSSQALDGILDGILTLQPEVLRHRGIMVNLQQEYAAWAQEQGRTVTSLTNTEKQTIALNAALAQGENIAGTYEAAMGTAGKQLRSMSRHVEEASNQFGQHLLPALGAVVEAGTGFLKWLQGLPEPVQATIAQVGALGGGLATLAGGAALTIPKLAGLGSAISGLAAGMGLSTAALLGPVGLIAALGTLVVYSENVKKAHREEAAEILKSAQSYEDYQRQIHQAGLESYAMSEGLYDVAKAAQAAGEAIDAMELQEARHRVLALANSWMELQKATPETFSATDALALLGDELIRQISKMSDMQLIIVANKDEMFRLAQQMGYSREAAMAFAEAVSQAARAQQEARQNTVTETEAVKRWVGWQREAATGADEVAEATKRSTKWQQIFTEATEAATKATGSAAEATGRLGGVMGGLGPAVAAAGQALSKVAIEAANAAAAEETFGDQLDLLHEAIKGEVGQAYDEFVEKNADAATKIQELTARIAELEGKKVLTADQYSELAGLREELGKTKEALDAETEAFERNINAIIYNIAERQILDALEKGLIEDTNASGTAFDEAAVALAGVAVALGLVDQGTVQLTQDVIAETEQFIQGKESASDMAWALGTMGESYTAAARDGDTFDEAQRRVREGMDETGARADMLGGKVAGLHANLITAGGGAVSLANDLNAIPRNIDVSVNITTHGGIPSRAVGGTGGGEAEFQHGGQFAVKGPGGIDRVPVFFRATAGEVVTVTPPGQVPPPDPTGRDRTYEVLMALIETLKQSRTSGASALGAGGQNVYLYGGQRIYGAENAQSLLEELQRLTM